MTDSPQRPEQRTPRYAADIQVLVFTKGLEHFLAERTANISEGGLFVCTEFTPEQGEKLHIRVTLADQDSYFDVKAQVVWLSDGTGPHPKGIGLQFVDLKEPQRRVIATVLKHYAHGTPTR